jgi:hypothetical protein
VIVCDHRDGGWNLDLSEPLLACSAPARSKAVRLNEVANFTGVIASPRAAGSGAAEPHAGHHHGGDRCKSVRLHFFAAERGGCDVATCPQ